MSDDQAVPGQPPADIGSLLIRANAHQRQARALYLAAACEARARNWTWSRFEACAVDAGMVPATLAAIWIAAEPGA
jgi:hypothetical protein